MSNKHEEIDTYVCNLVLQGMNEYGVNYNWDEKTKISGSTENSTQYTTMREVL